MGTVVGPPVQPDDGLLGSLSLRKHGLYGIRSIAFFVAAGMSEMKNSTRLFRARPAGVLLVAIGWALPIGTIPRELSRTPNARSAVATVAARFLERVLL